MPIEKLLQRQVTKLPPSSSCAEAARSMRDRSVGAVVVEAEGRPQGIVTDRDLAVRVMAQGLDPNRVFLRDVMSGTPIYLSKKRPLSALFSTMREMRVRRVMVVDEQGLLAGLVSMDDLIVLLADQFDALAEVVRTATVSSGADQE